MLLATEAGYLLLVVKFSPQRELRQTVWISRIGRKSFRDVEQLGLGQGNPAGRRHRVPAHRWPVAWDFGHPGSGWG